MEPFLIVCRISREGQKNTEDIFKQEKLLIDYIKKKAEREGKDTIHLASLWNIVSYYAIKHGFVFGPACNSKYEDKLIMFNSIMKKFRDTKNRQHKKKLNARRRPAI